MPHFIVSIDQATGLYSLAGYPNQDVAAQALQLAWRRSNGAKTTQLIEAATFDEAEDVARAAELEYVESRFGQEERQRREQRYQEIAALRTKQQGS